MAGFPHRPAVGTANLQATLSSSSAGTPADEIVRPDHTITCTTELRLKSALAELTPKVNQRAGAQLAAASAPASRKPPTASAAA